MKWYDNPEEQWCSKDFLIVRNYLVFNIYLRCAQRAGVASNMKCDNFLNALEVQGGKSVIDVRRHKTIGTHGNAQVILIAECYNVFLW